jgi:hypothetical protein
MLSPGVRTREIDFSMYAGEVSTCSLGMVGGASKGPIGIPTFCTSANEFVRIFGEPTDEGDYGAISALLFLSKGNSLWYVREANGDEAIPSVSFSGVEAQTGGTAQIETAVVTVGTVVAGDITVTVTGALVTGSPLALTVAVAESDTASMVAGKIRTAMNVAGITTNYTVGGADANVTLTAKVASANDATLNIAIDGGTTAVDDLTTSTDSTAGSAPTIPVATDILTIAYKTAGTYGEKYSFKITNASGLDFTLTIYEGKVVRETINASLDSTSTKYIGDKYSDEFTYTVVLGDAIAISNADKTSMTGGDNGLPLTAEQVIGTGNRGLGALANPNTVDISILSVPGRTEATILNKMLEVCENRADCFAVLDTPAGLTPTQAVAFHNGTLGEPDAPEVALNTSYGAMYYPWVKVVHPTTASPVWVPASSVVTGAYASSDEKASPWFAPAGLVRGKLSSVLDAEINMSEDEMNLLYGNDNAINPIINFRRQGFVIWGQRTLQREDTALDRVNVRRLMLYVRKIISASSAFVVFEQNDVATWNLWKSMINPFLEGIMRARGLYEYKVAMDATIVTAAHIDRNEMPGQVMLRPTKSAEFVTIDFVLKSTGATFGE